MMNTAHPQKAMTGYVKKSSEVAAFGVLVSEAGKPSSSKSCTGCEQPPFEGKTCWKSGYVDKLGTQLQV